MLSVVIQQQLKLRLNTLLTLYKNILKTGTNYIPLDTVILWKILLKYLRANIG